MAWQARWHISIQSFVFFLFLTTKLVSAVEEVCVTALGLEDGSLPDSQFTATSTYNSGYSPWTARLNSNAGWLAQYYNKDQYLTVEFTKEMEITGIDIQSSNNGWYTRQIRIFYSLDNLVWHAYSNLNDEDVFTANSQHNEITRIKLIPSIKAVFIAINPVSYSGRPALRLEMYGCNVTSPTPVRHTEVTNNIEATEEWIPSLSPYVINSAITIRPSGKLTIQAGVNVIFNSTDAGLFVFGSLKCMGTPGVPVRLWSSKIATCSATDWLGVEVSSPGTMLVEETDIRRAAVGIKGSADAITIRSSAIHMNTYGLIFNRGCSNSSTVTLDQVVISSNKNHGVRLSGWDTESYIQINNCRIESNGGHGLVIETDKSNINADTSSFSYNGASGIYRYNKGGSVHFRQCTFISNGNYGIHFLSYSSVSFKNHTLLSCHFKSNRYNGIYIHGYTVDDSHIEVTDSVFEGHTSSYPGVYVYAYSRNVFTMKFDNDTFTGDHCQIYLYSYYVNHDTNIIVTRSQFLNSTNGLQVILQRYEVSVDISDNDFTFIKGNQALLLKNNGGTIARNKFINCSSTVSTLSVSSAKTIISHNVFDNPESVYELKTSLPFDENSRVNVSENYWGQTDLHAVRSRVCDFFCDMDKAEFLLEPIFLSSNLTETSGNDSGREFTSDDMGDVGGVLTGDVILDADKLYAITRTIWVPAGITLTIRSNTTLQFHQNRGILVHGHLNFQTDQTDVLLTNYGSSKWKGVLHKFKRIINEGNSTVAPGEGMIFENVKITGASTCLRLYITEPGLSTFNSVSFSCDRALDVNLWEEHTVEITNSTTNNPVTFNVYTASKISVLLTNITSKTTSGNSLAVAIGSGIHGDVNMTILSSTYTNSAGWILNHNSYYGNISLTLLQSSISARYGIYLYAKNPQLNMQASNITTTYQAIQIYYTSSSDLKSDILINDCNIQSNNYYTTVKIQASQRSNTNRTFELSNSRLIGVGSYPIVEIYTYYATWNILLTGNTFTHTSTGWGVKFSGQCAIFTASQNTFSNIQNAMVLDVQGSPNAIISINHNFLSGVTNMRARTALETPIMFENNVVYKGNVVLISPDIIIRDNVFENITATYVINFASTSYKDREINASYNYWETTDFKTIRRKIYDSSSSPDLPTISIIPFYEFRNLSNPIFPTSTFLSEDGTVGGNVGGDVVLTVDKSPYIVVSNILVGKKESLTLEAGVKLLFQNNLKMIVEGKLNISGTYSSPVEVVPEVPTEKWGGIFLSGHVYLGESNDSQRIRLNNTAFPNQTNEGRIEVLVDGDWGTVCDDGFDTNDAMVVCRMMGFDPNGGVSIKSSAGYGQGTGPIHYGYLACTGGESSMFDCAYRQFSCGHYEDVGVKCSGNRLPNPEDILNDVIISNLFIRNTTDGITIDGNITKFENVTSTRSSTHGFTFSANINDKPSYMFVGLHSTHNSKSGIGFLSSSHHRTVDLTVSDCNLSDNGQYGLHMLGSHNATLSDCSIESNSISGVYVYNVPHFSLKVLRSNFAKNRRYAIYVTDAYSEKKWAEVLIDNCNFINHTQYSYYYDRLIEINLRYGRVSHISLLNNNVAYNTIIGSFKIQLANHNENSYVTVANNIVRHATGIVLNIRDNKHTNVIVFANNTVEHNASPRNEPLVNFEYAKNIEVSGNVFTSNTARYLLKLGTSAWDTPDVFITRNSFTNNSVTDGIVTSFYGISVHNNSFSNPEARCELATPTFNPLYSISAEHNYWGYAKLEEIVDRICGFDLDMTKCVVHYLPFYDSTELQSLSDSGFQDPLYSQAYGGEVHSMVTFQTQSSPFVIKRSIYIHPNMQLVIEKGTELIFEKNRGIYVEGQLVANGNSEEKISFKSTEDVIWHGVIFPFKPAAVFNNIRLVGTNNSNEGRVEILNNVTWYTVCDDRFTREEAAVVCNDLGFSSRDLKYYGNAHYSQGSGPILYDMGCSDYDVTQSECEPNNWDTSNCNHAEDAGVQCGDVLVQNNSTLNSSLVYVVLSGSQKGLVIDTNTLSISNCHIENNVGSGITLQAKVRTLNLDGTTITNSQSHGINAEINNYVLIMNGTVLNNNGHGIYVHGNSGKVNISDVRVLNNTINGISVTGSLVEMHITDLTVDGNLEYGIKFETFSYNKKVLTVTKSTFLNHQNTALYLTTKYDYYAGTDIIVNANEYVNNSGQSLYINSPSYNYNRPYTRNIVLRSNTFVRSGSVGIKTLYRALVEVKDNSFTDCSGGTDCFFTLDVYSGTSGYSPHNITISTNTFSRVTGRCVVLLKTNTNQFPGSFEYNQITGSNVDESVIIDNSPYINLTYNILDNPEADYELKVTQEGSGVITAIQNWWGTKDNGSVGARILDQHQDPRLFIVHFDPILTDQTFDCSQVNNCSGQGECVRPNGCRCETGWTGSNCTLYDCSNLGNCQGNGDCVGPNLCECSSGWTGDSCVTATCYSVANCSGPTRGLCILPNRCSCLSHFSGTNCSECAKHYWGPKCHPCPLCVHGDCDVNTGRCTCESENWTGELCDECSETFYGPNCLPFTNVLNVVPDSVRDTGGTPVHVYGHNFPETDGHIFYCKFDSDVVNGSWISSDHLTCESPKHQEGEVILEVSPDNVDYSRNMTSFSFYAVCPPGACYRDATPPHGQCLFGGCICNLPWSGDNCSVELFAPSIIPVANQVILEGDVYSLQLQLERGSPPVTWSLLSHPAGMSIGASSGLVQWDRAVASTQSYTLKVRTSNRIGRDEFQWQVTVSLSYNATVDQVLPGNTLPFPKTVTIKGHITFLEPNSLLALVDVKVENNGKKTMISAYISQTGQNKFEATYFPKAGDSGLFSVDARHPSDSGFAEQARWTVLGMACSPGYIYKQAYLDTNTVTFTGLAKLANTGVDNLENITAKVLGVSGPLTYAAVKIGSVSVGDASIVLIDQLQPGSDVSYDLILTATRPLRGTIAIEFSTPSGTIARMRVSIQLNIRRPVFQLSPTSLSDSIPQGHQKTFEVNITNLGEVNATNIQALLPAGSLLSLVSFGQASGESGSDGLLLEPEESALLVLTATASSDMELGETSGTIAINSDLASASMSYHFYITSLNKLDLVVRVEDEYTYFASDKPLVAGAEIRLINPRRGINIVMHTTNETGEITFANITEDQYTLRASAPGHASYSAVILAKMSDSKVVIFLQRIAVKYTWTVTPTTFEDKYVITLDSTFETEVPMPVVTIEPVTVNLIPFEEGKKTEMEFLLTNHGLIRADNVRFQLPVHPSLTFIQTIDTIGSLEANTSLVVPIRVEMKSRTKRSLAAAICGLRMLYDYYCGGTKTQGSDITLNRQYPGRPPLPCGGGGGSGEVSSGRARGYVGVSGGGTGHTSATSASVVYKPVTPLSCNCALTLIKSCVLAYHPVAGCAIGMGDLAGASSFLTGAVAALDTAMACVVGVMCSLCGLFYTTLRCVIDVQMNCEGQARRRRDAGSALVDEVIAASKSFSNYLDIMDEIFGDPKMLDFGESSWYEGFKFAIDENSAAGSLLSNSEVATIMTPYNETKSETLRNFLLRWNNTMAAWLDGTLNTMTDNGGVMSFSKLNSQFSQYKLDSQNAKDRGFDSIFDYFDHAKLTYDENEKKQKGADDGVCAKVRVRIVQELVLTRDAFNARLEIENGEESALEHIHVTIIIRATYGDGRTAEDLFSIGSPTLSGLSGVDGTGSLGRDVSGSAEWLIIPYSTAAVKDDTLYDIGGRLSYTVSGSNFSVPLLPDTITVKPNPSLIVHYFHEKYVQGDDPQTADIVEPIVPFSLAVMISNGAYGTARQLKLTSAQPEIIENEKGLLVSFKIIGAQLGNTPVTPSLSINFGDIESFETKTARWLLTSSLKGKFYNYTATFENINPLGDPQLSVMEKLEYHDLIHLVRIEHPNDDQLDDFLVNDLIDEDELPDVLYDSSNGFYNLPVVTSEVKKFEFVKTETVGSNTYTYGNLSVLATSEDPDVYGYTRVVNNITEDPLIQVTRSDGKQIMMNKNAWLTSYYHDKNYLHVFDLYTNVSTNAIASYEVVFGRNNIYAPVFKSQSYEYALRLGDDTNEPMTVNATDKSGDKVSYEIKPAIVYFTVNSDTGLISETVELQSAGVYTFTVIAVDDGIPPRQTSVNVTVTVTGSSTNTSPTQSTTSTTDGTESTTSSTTSDTTSATSDSTTATSDSTTATSDSTTATSDSTTATSDSTTATSQSTTSGPTTTVEPTLVPTSEPGTTNPFLNVLCYIAERLMNIPYVKIWYENNCSS